MRSILEGLNPAQVSAVKQTSGPLLILAGAGSGKTKTLAHRIAYLMQHEAVWPNEILAVTFTNKAARELRERVWQLTSVVAEGNGASRWLQGEERVLEVTSKTQVEGQAPPRNFMPWMGTFHGICVRLLRQDGAAISIKPNYVIYDEDDRRSLIKRAMKELSVDGQQIKPRAVSSIISNAKNELKTPDDFEASASYPHMRTIAKIYARYEKLRKEAGALDFDDLLIETVRLLRDHKDIRDKWRNHFKHIFIDEYQDTNAAQYAIVKYLVNESQNICVVGDDWQCLIQGSQIATSSGVKKIEAIQPGDRVCSAAGYGKMTDMTVTSVKQFDYDGDIVAIETESGKTLQVTPNHILFAAWKASDSFFVYLMYSRSKGYRIGIAKGTRFDGKKHDVGLRVRANQERADRMWVLEVCDDRKTALFKEARYAYEYGIPMTTFRAPSSENHMAQAQIDELFETIDTKGRAQKLLQDKAYSFEYPHFLPQATVRNGLSRVVVNVVLFGDKRTSAQSPWSASRLSINTTDPDNLEAFASFGYTVRSAKAGTYRSEVHNLDFGKIEKTATEIQAVSGDEIYLRRYTFMAEQPSYFMPASQIFVGMAVPVEQDGRVVEDKVVRVTKKPYTGKVYDIDVDKVHNYAAQGIIVHNSIYSWRGADFTNILNFERDYPGATVIKLEQNYRSTNAILNAAQAVISKNKIRTDKKLWTDSGEGTPVEVHATYDETEEASLIAGRISSQVAIKARRYRDFVVLYRMNAQSAALERALRLQRIPYQLVGGVRFYDRKEIKDIIAYLRLVYQPSDVLSFSRIVNVPTRGIGATSLEKFLTWQGSTDMHIIDALHNVEMSTGLTPKARRALGALGSHLRELQQMLADTAAPADIIERLLTLTNYREYLRDGTPRAEEREENIGSLLSDVRVFADLPEFLEEAALIASSDEQAAGDKVTLMTLHAAKGLEFPVVFMVGMEEGVFPHSRIYEAGPAELEEERRLCYVGMTRAREELHLTYARSRLQFGQRGYNEVSRFIADMGDQIAEVGAPMYADDHREYDFVSDELPFATGDRVRTAAFGEGEITEIDGMAVTIKFDRGGVKKLNAEYARLEKI